MKTIDQEQYPDHGMEAKSGHGVHTTDIRAPTLPRWQYTLLTVGICLGLFLSMLDSSIVATSLVSIAADFGTDPADAKLNWVALSYALTYLSCAVLFARASDVVGRRVAFGAAYVIFAVFSVACGFASNMEELIALRAIQGVGGAGLYSVSMIIMPELTPDNKKKYIAAVVGVVIASAGVLGPVLGGILTDYSVWRWVFWINGPISAVSILVFLFAWPNKHQLPALQRRAWKEVDFVGAFLLIASAVLIVFPFQHASHTTVGSNPWKAATFVAPLITGFFSLGLLFLWQYVIVPRFFYRRQSGEKAALFTAAALPPSLLRNRAYSAAALHSLLTGFPYILCIYAFPVRFQVVYGKSPLQAGLMLLPMLAASAVGTTVAGAVNGGGQSKDSRNNQEKGSVSDGRDMGRSTKRGKNRFMETLVAACLFMILGCALETMAESDKGIEPRVLGFLAFVGFGFGLSAAGATMLAGAEAPVREHASAQGIVAQVRILGGSLGIAASAAILGAKFRALGPASGVTPEVLEKLASNPALLTPGQWTVIRRVYTDALKEDMIVCCAVLGAALICSFGVYRRNRVSLEEMMEQRYREEAERRGTILETENTSRESQAGLEV